VEAAVQETSAKTSAAMLQTHMAHVKNTHTSTHASIMHTHRHMHTHIRHFCRWTWVLVATLTYFSTYSQTVHILRLRANSSHFVDTDHPSLPWMSPELFHQLNHYTLFDPINII